MSLLRHIAARNAYDPAGFRPFLIADQTIGRVRHDIAERLLSLPDLIVPAGPAIALAPGVEGFEHRSAALDRLTDALIEWRIVPRRRGELYAVMAKFGGPVLASVDRGAVAAFGIRAFGVHLNGIVDGGSLWIGTRALDKEVAPGQLDNIVAGGQPLGLSLMENLVKECGEEAGMAPGLARQAKPVTAISYAMAVPGGLRADTLFVYDLALPSGFVPVNTDGELDGFELMDFATVLRRVEQTEDFKFNVNLVIIDCLIRHGVIPHEHPDYFALIAGLRQDLPA